MPAASLILAAQSALETAARSLLLCMALAATGCAAPLAGAGPAPATPASPTLLAHPDQGHSGASRQTQLNALGYIEQEWRLHGQAQTYSADGKWGDDGHWALKTRAAAQPYDTRVLVRRPSNPARFNGIVVVEWLNTSLGFDLDGGWILARDELVREGYAWVGVSAETASVTSLKHLNPTRYAQAAIANSDMAFDVFTDAAKAIRQAAGQWGGVVGGGVGGIDTRVRLLAMGYSKSASYLITYINAFQPVSQAFDGFYMRGATPAAIQVNDWGINIVMPQIRTDLKAPLMQVQTEMEVTASWPLSRTPDTDKVRYWEIAGATHFDKYMQDEALAANQHDAQLVAPRCHKPSSTLPARLVDHAALHALRTWVNTGKPPPKAPRLQRSDWGFVQDDALGNALGGLRLPELDAPLTQYGMYSNFPTNALNMWAGFACVAGGSANPLGADVLRARYPSAQAYLQAYKVAADKLLSEGFLRPADHALMLQAAGQVALPH
jgi:Alpha/beta hydrolase domain